MGHRPFRLPVPRRSRSFLCRTARQGRELPCRTEERRERQPFMLRRRSRRRQYRTDAVLIGLMVPLSVLDLSPIIEGGNAGQALKNSLDLARHVEALGYRRFWMAEHHNLPGIASAATAVALAHVAAGTSTIRKTSARMRYREGP